VIAGLRAIEFLYLVNLEDGEAFFFNNVLEGGKAKDSVCVLLTRMTGDWYNNTVVGGEGGNITRGFHIRDGEKLRMLNNIVVRPRGSDTAGPLGEALNVIGGLPRELESNAFGGWRRLLEQRAHEGAVLTGEADLASELNAVDGNTVGGAVHRNIDAEASDVFLSLETGNYRLEPGSPCIDSGTDVSGPPYNGPTADHEGRDRPARTVGRKPQYDIGAYEFY